MINVPLHMVKHLHSGRVIVAQLESSSPQRYAFVGIHRHKGGLSPHQPEYERAPWIFNHERQETDSLKELDRLLGGWVGDPGRFQQAAENTLYPF